MAHQAAKESLQTLVRGTLNKLRFETHLKFSPQGRASGFTLLELLVVIVIVSVLFSFMTLAIRGASPEDAIKEEALRLNQLIQLALEEAVLRNTEYALLFSTHGYQFLQLNEDNWQTIEADKLLRKRELPLEMEIELSIEQVDVVIADMHEDSESEPGGDADEKTKKKLQPQVFLMSSEEITPEFSARFIIPGVEESYIVNATMDGKHTVSISDL
jgi:general secretion pathway protein H